MFDAGDKSANRVIYALRPRVWCIPRRFPVQVETLAEAGSYEDALSLCAMCKVRRRGGLVQ